MRKRAAVGPRRRILGVVGALGCLTSASAATPIEVSLRGVVRDEAGKPLAGVSVKAFVDGFLRAAEQSAEDGSYAVSWAGDAAEDPTVVVWWLPTARGQVPELALLREGARARALELWGPCIPRLSAHPDSAFDVVLYPEAQKLRLLGEADCLRPAPPGRP